MRAGTVTAWRAVLRGLVMPADRPQRIMAHHGLAARELSPLVGADGSTIQGTGAIAGRT